MSFSLPAWALPLIHCTLILFCLSSGSAQAEPAGPPDLLTLARGAVLVHASVDPVQALALTDGDESSSWSSSTRKKPLPYVFVFELIAPAQLSAVGIDGAGARPAGVQGGSAGTVRVEGSDQGPDRGFEPLAQFRAAEDGQTLVPVSTDRPLRWLRFTIQDPQVPDAPWLYFDEVIAQGRLTPPEAPDRFSGVFQIGRKDFVELIQTGDAITGCYIENGGHSLGQLSGAMQEGVALLSWISDQGITGTALLTRDSTGALFGVRYRQRSRSVWAGPVAPDGTITPCSPQQGEPLAAAPVDPIVAALETLGVARLYGIHFEYDSDVPKPSARPALERFLAALQAAPTLKIDIEGHTDADGSDAYNLDLSDRRARSVVSWLVGQGIAADRLRSRGMGEAVPVASNTTADGKALNRRVELRKR